MVSRFWRIRRRSLPQALFASSLGLSGPFVLACAPFGETPEEPVVSTAPLSAQEILDRYVQAVGGEQALRAIHQRTEEAELLFKAQEGCEEGDSSCLAKDTPGQFMLFSSNDGRMFRSTVIGEQIVQAGFDGKTGWQYQVEPPLLILEEGVGQNRAAEEAVLHWYFGLKTRGIEPKIQEPRTEEASGNLLDGLAWNTSDKSLPTRVLWFDRSTGLLHEETEKDEVSGAIERRFFSDYRKVDGVLVPHNIRKVQAMAGRKAEVQHSVIAVHHRPIDSEKFSLPTLPTPEPVGDERLAHFEAAQAARAVSPDDPTVVIDLARAAFTAAHFDAAAAAAEATLKLDPKDAEALWIVGQVQLLKGHLDLATKALQKAEKLGLREDQAARQQAWIQLRKRDWKAAGTLLSSAANFAKPAPKDEGAKVVIGTLAAMGERYSAFEGEPLVRSLKTCEVRVPMTIAAGAMMIEVTAENEKLRLLLDTTAPDIILGDRLAKSLVVATDAHAPLLFGGPFYPRGQIDQVEIGALSIKNVPATIFNEQDMATTTGGLGIDGVLGIAVLAPYQITFDLRNEALILVKNERRCKSELAAHRQGPALPFWIHETHNIYVMAEMNGAEGIYQLNSGMRGADLTANELAYAHAGIGAPPMRRQQVPMVTVNKLRLGAHESTDLVGVYGYSTQLATLDGFRLDGMIGMGTFASGSVTLDFDEQRIYQVSAQQSPTPTPLP